MVTEYGITAAGFIPKNYTVILNDLTELAKSVFGSDIDLNQYSPLGQLIQIFAYQHALIWKQLEATYYSGYINSATGTHLDKLLAILGLTRKPAEYAVTDLTFTTTRDITIDSGTIVTTSNGTISFTTDGSLTISANSSGTISATATTQGTDSNVLANTLTTISPRIANVSVTNLANATGGIDTETDQEFRYRALYARNESIKATKSAIISAVEAISGVNYCLITEDLEENSIEVSYAGTALSSAVTAVVDATRACGIPYTVTQISEETVRIYAELKPVTGSINIPSLLDEANTVTTDYMLALDPGSPIEWNTVYKTLIRSIDNIDDVTQIWIRNTTEPLSETNPITAMGSSITPSSGQRYTPTDGIFWINGLTYSINVDITIATDTDCGLSFSSLPYTNTIDPEEAVDTEESATTKIQNAIYSAILDTPVGTDLNWTDLSTAALEAANYTFAITSLNIYSGSTHYSSPDSTISISSNSKILPSTIESSTAVPIYITISGRIILNESSTSEPTDIESATKDYLYSEIWKLAKETALLPSNLSTYSENIKDLYPTDIKTIPILSASDTSAHTVTLTEGTVPCTTNQKIYLIDASDSDIEIATELPTTITAIIERTTGANIAAAQAAISSAISSYMLTRTIGDDLTWDEISDIITTNASTDSLWSLELEDTNETPINSTGTSLPAETDQLAYPTTISLTIADLVPITITSTITKVSDAYSDYTVQQSVISAIQNNIVGQNQLSEFTYNSVYDAILAATYNDVRIVSSISSLIITADTSTLDASGEYRDLAETDYAVLNTATITIST